VPVTQRGVGGVGGGETVALRGGTVGWARRVCGSSVEVGVMGTEDLSGPDRRILLHDLRRTLSPGWLPDVLVALSGGPLPYTGLLRTLRTYEVPRGRRWPQPMIQEAVLTRTLRWMQRRGLVERARERVFPFGTVYWLTPEAKELADLVTPMAQWAAAHEELLEVDRREWSERRRRKNGGGKRLPRSG